MLHRSPSSEAIPQAICMVSYPSSLCCLAPSQRSSPQDICTVSCRPACCLAPSQRSSPQDICTVSSPSSMLSRSLPAKLSPSIPKLFQRFPLRPACCLAPSQLSASYLHGFLSVQHAVSLPPSEALLKLLQAICTVSSLSSMLSLQSICIPSFLPSFLPPFLPPSLPPSLPSFLPSSLLLGKNTTRWMGDSSGFSSVFLDYFTSDLHICNS